LAQFKEGKEKRVRSQAKLAENEGEYRKKIQTIRYSLRGVFRFAIQGDKRDLRTPQKKRGNTKVPEGTQRKP